jgi:PIF1-like helicase
MGVGVVAAATTGIAALLLPGGITAHSAYRIPIDVDSLTPSQVKYGEPRGEELRNAQVLITDEISMMDKVCFHHIDKTLASILPHQERHKAVFGNKLMLVSGDFAQILPIVQGGTVHDCAAASIKNSELFTEHFRSFQLTGNKRVEEGQAEFRQWSRDVGLGRNYAEGSENEIDLPDDMCVDDLLALIEFCYPSAALNAPMDRKLTNNKNI